MTAVTEDDRTTAIVDLRDGRCYSRAAVEAYRQARLRATVGESVDELIDFLDEWEATH